MKVLLIGSTGFSGKEVLKELLAQGHQVTATTRSANSLHLNNPNLEVLEGNIMNPLFLQNAIKEQDAVINCLGIGGKGNGRATTLMSDSARILVNVMENSSAKRLIAMSNVGAGDSERFQPFIFRKFILPYFMKWLKVIIDDKNRMEPIIENSALDWTVIRCPNITDKEAKGTVNATLDGKGLKLSITNKDLARFMVGQLTDNLFVNKMPSISN